MALPEVGDRADLDAFLGSDEAHPFVVFRYRGAFSSPDQPETTFTYAWLVLRDPTVSTTDLRYLYARWADSAGGTALRVPLLHDALGDPLEGLVLPYREASYAPSTAVALRFPGFLDFTLDTWDEPVLLLSDEEIQWAVFSARIAPGLP
jgi:hypothetical protein